MASAARIGIALGSGAARGWAHIGVLNALAQAGIEPQVVCGSSIGALVGAAYASGHLEQLEQWVLDLDALDVARLLDIGFTGGGFIRGERLMETLSEYVSGLEIQATQRAFGCVATDLESGRELWLRSGPLARAVRASIALPGLMTPAPHQGRWLVDGGLVDPVPVSLCRAMGADLIIAVNLNSNIVGKHFSRGGARGEAASPASAALLKRLPPGLRESLPHLLNPEPVGKESPGLLDVLATAINIMQDRITRSRMSGDPPDVTVSPRMSQVGLMEFHRAREAIDAGAAAADQSLPAIRELLGR